MTDRFLKVQQLTKTYANQVEALKSVSFEVQQGDFLAVIGSSGSGKSTLLRCLNRLHEPTSGEIFFRGREIARIHQASEIRRLRKQMAFIFQSFHLIPRKSVLDNVLMGALSETGTLASLLGWFPRSSTEEALRHLKAVGILDKASARADQLSGGQQQRVAIARALLQKPQLLLADEPVASLDPVSRQSVMNTLRQVHQEQGLTVIANLHSISLVRQYANRCLALKEGQVVFDGPPSQINEALLQEIYATETAEKKSLNREPLG